MAAVFLVIGALGLVVLLLSLFVGELGDLGIGDVDADGPFSVPAVAALLGGIGFGGAAATSLLPDDRAAVERDLVQRYHAALLAHGVSGYDVETCWQDYRLGVFQAPLITALGFAFAASTERGDEMILTMLHRGCRAIRELGAIDLVRSYQASTQPSSPTTA